MCYDDALYRFTFYLLTSHCPTDSVSECVRFVHNVVSLQVFDVVREQITRALQYQLTALDQLRTKLGHLAYQDITNLREAERVAKEHEELLATPIQYVLRSFVFLSLFYSGLKNHPFPPQTALPVS